MANNDNAMTRFLFAILQQKCLKDIDWNKVAQDPNLAQPITNGHAARMRYSRFRSAMLGIEPQRRNKVTKPSATKKKKAATAASTAKKEDGDGGTEDAPANSDGPSPTKKIKLEKLSPTPQSPQLPPPTMAATPATRSEIDTVKIKKERAAPSPPTTSAMSMPGTPIDTSHFTSMMHSHRQSPTPAPQPTYNHTMRLLTPCSDHQSPISVQAQASDVLMHHNLNQGFMTAAHNSPLSANHDFHQHHHGNQSQAQSPYDHHAHHFDAAVASHSSPWGHSHISQSSPVSVSMYSPTTPAFGYAPSAAAATNCDHAHSQHTQYSQQQQTQDEHNPGLMGIGMGLAMNTMNMNLGGMNMGQLDFNNMVMQAQRTSISPAPPAHPIKGEDTSGSPHWGTMDAGFV